MKLKYEIFYCDMWNEGDSYYCNEIIPFSKETIFSFEECFKEKQIIKSFNRFLGVEMTVLSYDDYNDVYELYNDDLSEMYQLRGV